GEAPEHLDEVPRVVALTRRRHEHDERLVGVASFAKDEMPQVSLTARLVVGGKAFLACPFAYGIADRVAELRRQKALVDRQHLVPAAGAMKARRWAVSRLGERVLELVAVMELGRRRNDRLERRLGNPSEARQRVADLRLLRRQLLRVCQVLEAAAAAGAEVAATSRDAPPR